MKQEFKRITGRLTEDPVVKKLESEAVVCNTSIAVNAGKEAQFFNLEAWGEHAEQLAEKHKKGHRIQV